MTATIATPPLQPLILCADDFALTLATAKVIADLAAAGRLSAIACMAGMADWRPSAPLLEPLVERVDIGLHLTLTGEAPLTAMPRLAGDGRLPSINALIRASRRGELPLDEIEREIDAQFARFRAATGRRPDFVDGHQHFHALPDLREIVLAATAHHAPHAWLRNCEDRPAAVLRRPFRLRALRSAWLCGGLAEEAAACGIATNRGFAGFYNFSARADFGRLFGDFVTAPGAAPLVMVHPGANDAPGDSIAAARVNEARFLGSAAFPALLAARGLQLARGSTLLKAAAA